MAHPVEDMQKFAYTFDSIHRLEPREFGPEFGLNMVIL